MSRRSQRDFCNVNDIPLNERQNELTVSGSAPGKAAQATTRDDMERGDEDVYRRLYLILSLMSAVMFAINVLQISLLNVTTNYYWIALFPGLVFLIFLVYIGIFAARNAKSLFDGDITMRSPLQHAYGRLSGNTRALESEQQACTDKHRKWPKTSSRIGVVLTVFLNIILCEFVYLNTFAVPDFNTLTWTLGLNASTNLEAPSVAVIQNVHLNRRAILENDTEVLTAFCQNLETQPLFEDQRCLTDFTSSHLPELQENINYVRFDGSTFRTLNTTNGVDIWYKYSFNSSVTTEPLLAMAVFDTTFLETGDFVRALECGIISPILLQARKKSRLNVQRFVIDDQHNAMHRKGKCNIDMFRHYVGYRATVTSLGEEPFPGSTDCDLKDLNSPTYNGSCNADIWVTFPTLLTETYTSAHGKDWKTIFAEEGGIIGFVTFMTWFFGIFEA